MKRFAKTDISLLKESHGPGLNVVSLMALAQLQVLGKFASGRFCITQE